MLRLASSQIPDGFGKYGVKLSIAEGDSTEEEAPLLAIAYHNEDRVITCNR